MKTPEYKGPAELSYGSYTENCKLITLPEGYRFLKIGEKSRKEDFHTSFGRGQWRNNEEARSYGVVINGCFWPHIRKVDYVRGPKGRFVSAKPAPPAPKVVLNKKMVDWIARVASNERDYAVMCVKRYKEFLAGDETGCMNFPWYDTPNSHRWNSIYGGSIKPTEADKEYVRTILEAMEKGLEGKTPPPAPKPETKEKPLVTIYAEGTGPSRKYRVEHGGAQLEEGDKELLKGIDTFRSVSKELADLKAWKQTVVMLNGEIYGTERELARKKTKLDELLR